MHVSLYVSAGLTGFTDVQGSHGTLRAEGTLDIRLQGHRHQACMQGSSRVELYQPAASLSACMTFMNCWRPLFICMTGPVECKVCLYDTAVSV